MKNLLLLSLLAVLSVGCGGADDSESVTPPAQPQASQVADPAASVAVTAPNAPAAPPTGAVAPASSVPDGPAESAPMDATAQEKILAAMQSYVIDNSANPKSLEELVTKRYLKSLPPAPEGKKWVYNPEKLAIEAVAK